MAEEIKFARKFTSGPFKGLLFEKRDIPNKTDCLELEFVSGKKVEVSKQEYRDWSEADAGTVAPYKSSLVA